MERLKELAEMAQQRPGVQIVCVSSSRILSQQKMEDFLLVYGEDGPAEEWIDENYLYIQYVNRAKVRFLIYSEPVKIKGWEADVIWVDTHGMEPELRGPIVTACKQRLRGQNEPLLFAVDDEAFEDYETLAVGVKHLIPPVETDYILPPMSDEQRRKLLFGTWNTEEPDV